MYKSYDEGYNDFVNKNFGDINRYGKAGLGINPLAGAGSLAGLYLAYKAMQGDLDGMGTTPSAYAAYNPEEMDRIAYESALQDKINREYPRRDFVVEGPDERRYNIWKMQKEKDTVTNND